MIKGRTKLSNEARGTMLLCCLIMKSNSIALMLVTRTTTLGQAELFQQLLYIWITMKFVTDIHGSQRTKPHNFGDPHYNVCRLEKNVSSPFLVSKALSIFFCSFVTPATSQMVC